MCCNSFLKCMMFVFNGCIFLAGAVILGVGVWAKVDSDSLLGLMEDVETASVDFSQVIYVSYVLIGLGAFLLFIGFLGCCGAIKESRCMLLTFFVLVLLIFLAEVAIGVVLIVFQSVANEIFNSLEDEVQKVIRKDYGKVEGFTSLWNNTMAELKCCGYKNYSDFTGSPFNRDNGQIYPAPCCNETITVGVCDENAAELSNVDGCFSKLLQLIEDNVSIIAGVALGIAALEIAAMVVSMVLYKSIGSKA
ncbi:tetraspanin 34 [Thalassophryne amazonica]|uniref:tetraspanin 34 n=1 Tax=Thalassophryne amazonica TaxID=390379 RepID=UPI0014726A0F|nr:tetraspanin 34 [Thalassophryne amazonica]